MFFFAENISIQEHAEWHLGSTSTFYSAYGRRNEWARHLGPTVCMKGRENERAFPGKNVLLRTEAASKPEGNV
jgi:hypothetical protein